MFVDPTLTRAAARALHPDAGFRAVVPGAVYAQPIYVSGRDGGKDLLIVATERNDVAALEATSGATVWTRHLGEPVALSKLRCGNIDPLGVTGTPVADGASRTVYLDAMTTPDGGTTKRHLVFALSIDDGSIRSGWPVIVAQAVKRRGLTFDDAAQNQRGALALAGGTVYVPFGGHFGDCGDYRGLGGGHPGRGSRGGDRLEHRCARRRDLGAERHRGGGWAALRRDRQYLRGEDLGWRRGDPALPGGRPPPSKPVDWFTPSNWKELDEGDIDIGGTGPVILDLPGAAPSRLVVELGKDGKMYVLDREHLGGVGGHVVSATVSSSSIITAAVAYATAHGTYVAFRGEGSGCPRASRAT